MLKIGMCVGCVDASHTANVKRSKIKVTRSNENCAQNIKYMPQTSCDSGNIAMLYIMYVANAGANGVVRFLTGSS